MPKQVVIYSDGACKGNPGPGGWGAVLEYGDARKLLHGGELVTTNNRMELMAAIEALKQLRRPCQVALYTDSQYMRKGIMEWMKNWKRNGWRTAARKPVKNADLWQQLDELAGPHEIAWHWVKGHSGHPGNDLADELANKGVDEVRAKTTARTG